MSPSLYSCKLTKYLKTNLSSLEVMAAGTWWSELRHVGLAIRKQCVRGDEGQNLRWGWGEERLVDGKLSLFLFFVFCRREDKEPRPLFCHAATSWELLGTSAANKAYKHFKQCAAV